MALPQSEVINVPEQYWNISHYRATLGHKVNHSFNSTNSRFGLAYHPRFGNIRAIYAIKNITKGSEIFSNYAYKPGSAVPEWYSSLYKIEMGKSWYVNNQRPSTGCRCSCSHQS